MKSFREYTDRRCMRIDSGALWYRNMEQENNKGDLEEADIMETISVLKPSKQSFMKERMINFDKWYEELKEHNNWGLTLDLAIWRDLGRGKFHWNVDNKNHVVLGLKEHLEGKNWRLYGQHFREDFSCHE